MLNRIRRKQSVPCTVAVGLQASLSGARHLSISLLLVLTCSGARADQTEPPRSTAQDLVAMFRLPPLKDKPSDPLTKSLKQLQVLQRAEKLHVTSQTALAAWRKGEETFSKAKTRIAGQDAAFTLFQGSKSSELNRFLQSSQARAVKVNSPQIEVP